MSKEFSGKWKTLPSPSLTHSHLRSPLRPFRAGVTLNVGMGEGRGGEEAPKAPPLPGAFFVAILEAQFELNVPFSKFAVISPALKGSFCFLKKNFDCVD